MKRRAAIASAFAACLSGCGPARTADQRPRWPELPVTELSGQPATLPGASGQPRLVNMWALWCAPCRVELPALERLGLALAPQGVQVAAIALADDPFAVREYLAQNALRLRAAVVAPRRPEVLQLGLDSLPQTFVVARDGRVLAGWIGARDWDAPQVRAEIAALLLDA